MYSELAPEKKGMRMRGGIITFFAIALMWQLLWPLIYWVVIPSIDGYDISFDFIEFALGNPQYLFWAAVPLAIIIHAIALHKFIPAKIVFTVVIALLMAGYMWNVAEYKYFNFPSELYYIVGIISMILFLLTIIFVLIGKGGRGLVIASFCFTFVISFIEFCGFSLRYIVMDMRYFAETSESEFLYMIANLPIGDITFLVGLFLLGLASCKVKPAVPVYNAPVYNVPPYNPQPYVQPQYVQPQYVQPQYAQPQFEQPQFEQPQFEQPQFEQPQFEQPQFEQPQEDAQTYDTAADNTQESAVQNDNSAIIDTNIQN